MRASLRTLENVRAVRQDDPHLVLLKNTLREKIAQREREISKRSDELHAA
jgi:hypothetical protein